MAVAVGGRCFRCGIRLPHSFGDSPPQRSFFEILSAVTEVDKELESPAFHEAGHVAVADYFGHYVEEVWIAERDGCYTPAKWTPECSVREREFRLQQIIALQAGRAAIDHLHGCEHEWPNWDESADRRASWKLALWLSDGDQVAAEHLLRYAARRAELLVEKLWPRIEKLACALLQKQKFTGPEIIQILCA